MSAASTSRTVSDPTASSTAAPVVGLGAAGADPQADRVDPVTVVVQRAERLAGDLADAVVAVGPRRERRRDLGGSGRPLVNPTAWLLEKTIVSVASSNA